MNDRNISSCVRNTRSPPFVVPLHRVRINCVIDERKTTALINDDTTNPSLIGEGYVFVGDVVVLLVCQRFVHLTFNTVCSAKVQ